MGILDDITSKVNQGVATADRSTKKMRIKSQLNDITKRRQQLAAQLGASLYEATREDASFRSGREALYDGIAQLDAERDECNRQIEELDRMEQQAQVAAQTVECPKCHTRCFATDTFCSGCGMPVADMRAPEPAAPAASAAPAGAKACPFCGAPVNEGDVFCMSCGKRMDEAPAPEPTPAPEQPAAPEPASEPAPAVEPETVPEPAASGEPVCPGCGAPVKATDTFCMKCGTRLK